ncbi:MAG: MBL fold metallo-hydrolase [Verrucomicrobiae bacterium]|nr:MBL fold metallo-hydrolase [Verrucomicrobiae bacterium]
MNLEDHVGDIVQKACSIKGKSIESVAEVVGMNVYELFEFIKSGHSRQNIDYEAVGSFLGISSLKLKNIAHGWHPRQIDLSQWNIKSFVSEKGFSVNCYLLWDAGSAEAALFDTGFNYAAINQFICGKNLKLKSIFITHNHHDHIELVPLFKEKFSQIVCYNFKEDIVNNQEFQLGALRIKAIHIPTHSNDSFAYFATGFMNNLPPVVFAGDIIFAGSVGRMPHYDGENGLKLIRENILTLPSETIICPGHGPTTTVEEELKNNPFF